MPPKKASDPLMPAIPPMLMRFFPSNSRSTPDNDPPRGFYPATLIRPPRLAVIATALIDWYRRAAYTFLLVEPAASLLRGKSAAISSLIKRKRAYTQAHLDALRGELDTSSGVVAWFHSLSRIRLSVRAAEWKISTLLKVEAGGVFFHDEGLGDGKFMLHCIIDEAFRLYIAAFNNNVWN